MPTGRSPLTEGIMCTPGGAAATAKEIETIGDTHLEKCEGQVRHFGGFIAFFFLLKLHPFRRVKTPAVPIDGI